MRTFISADIPDESRSEVALFLARLRTMKIEKLRWVQPEAIHLTLKFLGEINQDRVGSVLSAMNESCDGASPFGLSTGGLGCFPNRRSLQVVWLGLEGDMEALGELQGKLDGELHQTADLPMENRPFRPHLTLARVRRGATEADRRQIWETIEATPPPEPITWHVSQLSLVHSTLLPQGPEYRTLGSAPLRGLSRSPLSPAAS